MTTLIQIDKVEQLINVRLFSVSVAEVHSGSPPHRISTRLLQRSPLGLKMRPAI
jgi:hypothetical protein